MSLRRHQSAPAIVATILFLGCGAAASHPSTDPNISPQGIWVDAGQGHRLFCLVVGQPGNVPVVFLHGGPGGFVTPDVPSLFDPAKYYAVMCDQRGAGQSTPAGELRANDTDALIDDIERIRRHFALERFLLVGVSWGTSLSLLYAERYPQRVAGLLLASVFLARPEDLTYPFAGSHDGAEVQLLGLLDPDERADPWASYARRILDRTDDQAREAALRLLVWMSSFNFADAPHPSEIRATLEERLPQEQQLQITRVLTHFTSHGFFISSNEIMDSIERVADTPTIIVHGRQDRLCSLAAAEALGAALGDSDVLVVETGTHTYTHPDMRAAIERALSAFDGRRFNMRADQRLSP